MVHLLRMRLFSAVLLSKECLAGPRVLDRCSFPLCSFCIDMFGLREVGGVVRGAALLH